MAGDNFPGERIESLVDELEGIIDEAKPPFGKSAQYKVIETDVFFNILDEIRMSYPEEWQKIQIDEEPMLEDLLESGIYGNSSLSRMHSSNITLNAVVAGKKGRKVDGTVLRTVFPPLRQMEYRYTYLKKAPFLLPVAWAERILKYRKETGQMPGNEAVESVKIGSRRTEMMKQYGIIK